MDRDETLRHQLAALLHWEDAHVSFDTATADLPPALRGARPEGQPHTPWRLIEHIRICQWDILEFCRNPDHVSPEFPAGHWPPSDAPPDDAAWDRSIEQFRTDRQALLDMIADPHTDLLAPLPHATNGQTIFREVLLAADHTAYHLGQLVLIRRLLGAWTPKM